jgi:hypothetical protein
VLDGNNPRFPWVPFRVTLSAGLEAPRDLDVTVASTASIHLDNRANKGQPRTRLPTTTARQRPWNALRASHERGAPIAH